MERRASRAKDRFPWPLGALVVLALWPYWRLLGQWPMTMDAAVWIERGLPGSPGLLDWAFRTRQFGVGWRPLTALSYTLGTLVGGVPMYAQRALDLAAHVACALLVYALARSLAPRGPRWAAGFSALLFAVHPAVDSVAPYLARRSYSLATACLLGALVIAVRSLDEERPAAAPALRSVLSGALLLAGFLVHEIAVVGALLLPLLGVVAVRGRRDRLRAVAFASALPVLLLGLGWWARSRVVTGVGGYDLAAPDAASGAAFVIGAFLKALLAAEPAGPAGAGATTPALAVAAVAGTYYLGSALAAVRRRSFVPLALAAWVAGFAALYALLGVWFARQAYVAVAPLALLAGVDAARTFAAGGARGRLLRLIPQAAFVLLVLAHSPVLRGLDPVRTAAWSRRNALLEAGYRGLAGVREPAAVRLVLPYRRGDESPGGRPPKYKPQRDPLPREARQPARWMERLAAGRDIRLEEFVFFEEPPQGSPWPALVTAGGGPALRIPDRLAYYVAGEERDASATRVLPAGAPELPRARAGYLFLAGPAGGTLHELPAGDPGGGPGAARR